MNAQGFYKLHDTLCHGPNQVLNANYTLSIELSHTYQYPVDGWYYFENENAARTHFDLPLLVENSVGEWVEQ